MGKKDGIMTEYYKDKARYADLVNVCVFRGRQVVKAQDVHEKDPRAIGILGRLRNRVLIQKYRDMIRKIVLGMNMVLVALENQDQIHYAMPIRIMMEDAAGYDEQMRQIQKWHNRKRDLKGAEFLGQFSRSDKISPIVTLVLYYGAEPWSGAKDLHQMMDFQSLPEELRTFVNNYPIHVIEMRSFGDVVSGRREWN